MPGAFEFEAMGSCTGNVTGVTESASATQTQTFSLLKIFKVRALLLLLLLVLLLQRSSLTLGPPIPHSQ
jgi:hypothetical protein